MYTYLIIDDEALIRKGTIKKISPMSDVSCIGEAGNGKEGLRLVEELSPDFVILDMQMPEMDGMELLPLLAERHPDLPLIVISGYRDFDYIKQAISANAIEYILKPFSREDIQKCIQKVLDRLEQRERLKHSILNSEQEKEEAHYALDMQMLRDLIMGYHKGSAKLTSKKLNFINSNLNLILLTLCFSRAISERTMRDWLGTTEFGSFVIYLSSTDHSTLGFLILFLPAGMAQPVGNVTRDILNELRVWLEGQDIRMAAGISQVHTDLSELPEVYAETSQALNQRPICAGGNEHQDDYYYYHGDASPKPLTWSRTEEFLYLMDSGKEREVSALVGELFNYYQSLPHCTLADAKYHCYLLTENCRQILSSYLDVASDRKSTGSIQNIVNHIFSLEELREYHVRLFANLAAAIHPYTVYAVDDLIEKIQIYIRRNYQKNLTQELISSIFSINRSYFSTLFKAQTGEKFVDYLNKVRIRKSEELLTSTNYKMYQIARAIGYDNVKYYFRVFKKYNGMTPEQFRTQNISSI